MDEATPRGVTERRKRLAALGVLAMVTGIAFAGLAVLVLLIPVAERVLPEVESIEMDPRSILVQAFLLLSFAAAFVWLGLGSLKRRRWVRPLMLILAWTWLLGGVTGMLYLTLTIETWITLAASTAQPPTDELRRFVKTFVLGAAAVLCLTLPAVFILGYQSRRIQRALALADPTPSWTDRCPLPVLGLSVGLAASAFLALPSAAYAVLPVFDRLVTGWPAVLLTLLGAAACAYLARSTFRLEMPGWWGSLALFLLTGVSASVTFLRVDMIEIYRALGYPETHLELLREAGTPHPVWMAGLVMFLTIACLAYMIHVRSYFARTGPASRG